MTDSSLKILLAYDGSDPAKEMITEVATLFPGANVVVANVWKSIITVGYGGYAPMVDYQEIDEEFEKASKDLAAAGADSAKEQGLNAISTSEFVRGNISTALLDIAEKEKCDMIAVGSVGHSAIGRLFLGSVSQGVVSCAKLPVLVVRPRKDNARK